MPTAAQAVKAVILCQWLSNGYQPINVLRYDFKLKTLYIQAGVNQSVDHFIFDVTNGITWLRGLMLKIVIIPENLYIQTRNVSVEEGNWRIIYVKCDH